MDEASKIAARAKIFAALGLGPDGMCRTTTFPTLRNIEANQDAACRSILNESELEPCAAHEIGPSTFLIARGPVPAVKERDPLKELETFVHAHGGTIKPIPTRDDDSDIEMAMENLARCSASVGDKKDQFDSRRVGG
jgi:hypothetical protein